MKNKLHYFTIVFILFPISFPFVLTGIVARIIYAGFIAGFETADEYFSIVRREYLKEKQ